MSSPFSDFAARRDFLRTLGAAGVGGLVASLSAVVGPSEPTQLGEGVFELGDVCCSPASMLRNAKLAYKTHGQLNAAKTNVILYPTQFAAQHGDIEWLIGPGRALDPGPVLHHRSGSTWQRLVLVAEQHAATSRSDALSNHHHSGRHCRAAPVGDRGIRNSTRGSGDGVVDGRPTSVSMGGEPSGHGRAHRSFLRHCEDDPAQRRVPRGCSGRAHCGCRLDGGRLPGSAVQGMRALCTGLCRLGVLAAVLQARTLPTDGIPLAGGFHHRLLGEAVHAPGREQSAVDAPYLAAQRSWAQPQDSAAVS